MDERTLADLQFHRLIEAAADCCQTSRGREAVLGRTGARDAEACDAELGRVEEAALLLDFPEPPSLDRIEDVTPSIVAASKGGVLASRELVACGRLLQRGHEIRRRILDLRLRVPGLAAEYTDVKDLGSVAERVLTTFDEDGRIRDDASPRLGELRQQAIALGRRVKERVESMLADARIQPVLQDAYYTLREGRYVLPVKTEDRRFVPGIIHGTSQTGATLFIEPEGVVEENNRLKVVQDQVEVEEFGILSDRSRLVGRFAQDAVTVADALWSLDSALGRGRLGRRMGGTRPKLATRGEGLLLRDARNPVLALLGRNVVPVTVSLPVARTGCALVISGPNAGGKSVTLSTVGLCCVMARFGLLPPVGPDSVVPWHDTILTVTGDPTSMDRQVSTFTGQLARVREALDRGPGRALLLLDELATGTEPRRGEALAVATVEALVGSRAECIVATHYDALKKMSAEDERFLNARVGVDPRTGLPNFLLEQGSAGESNPFEVAAAAGFPATILERAKALVGERERRLDQALAEAERLKAELTREKAETEDLRKKLAIDKRTYERELQRIRGDSDRLVYEARREVLQKMRRLEEELDQIAKQARKEKEEAKVTVKRREVGEKRAEVRQDMDREATALADLPSEPVPAGDVKPGATVFVLPLRSNGVIAEVAADGKRAVVQVGAMKSTVKVADLRKPKAGGKGPKPQPKPAPAVPSKPLPPPPPPDGSLPMRTPDNTVDVRGMRVDEALAEVERFLDAAFLREEAVVVVIHGMGTSALRKAIRDALKTSKYCRSFRTGDMDEGGDGVTIVTVT
jgi:DNA mismatch repair protein MutS2